MDKEPGRIKDVSMDDVKAIIEMYNREFEIFKKEEEVIHRMTVIEYAQASALLEGFEEGREEGRLEERAEINSRIEDVLRNSHGKTDAMSILADLADKFGISGERLNMLLSKNTAV